MSHVSPLLLFRRFAKTCRQEGIRTAASKVRSYIARRFRRNPVVQRTRPTGPEYLEPMWRTLAQQGAFHISSAPAVLSKRRQIALIGDLNLPQCRKYRVEQLAQFWQGQGIRLEYAHFEDIPRATRILQQASHLMEYRLQCTPTTQMLRYEAHRLRLPILYDLDDPLFSVSAYETYSNMQAVGADQKSHFLAAAPSYLDMMNGADIVSVSTPGMATHAALFSNRSIYLRRNFADAETLAAGRVMNTANKKQPSIFRIAFASGSCGHEADLETILKPLTEFILAAPNRRLRVLGHFDLKRLPKALLLQVEQCAFTTYSDYLNVLSEVDCAVVPLAKDAFNDCKSAVRVLDAAAVSVPSIVSDVGDLGFVVKEGETGYVARQASDWEAILGQFVQPGCAEKMGQAARQNLETRWRASTAPHIIDPEILRWVLA